MYEGTPWLYEALRDLYIWFYVCAGLSDLSFVV